MKFKYFTYKEFDCKGGQGKGENMDDDFICMLDDARELARLPFKITSGYRTPEYNKRLIDYGFQASITSSHIQGLAADIEVKASEDRFRIIGSLMSVGIHRIGIGKDFIHCDIDENKKPNLIWTYY
jgi:zinc D-Ala-D-Ala carboxypeptidase|tara:strand:- start:33 stop:410 length:378 start_codon:yes stop_codon:yes gene_type:complete